MSKLLVPLSVLAETGAYDFEATASEADLRPQDANESALVSAHVAGQFQTVDSERLFRGTLTGDYEQPCDRCLEPAKVSVEIDVAWCFKPGSESDVPESDSGDTVEADSDDKRVRFFQDNRIDLGPHLWEELVLASPTKFYCHAACKGLCPRCGGNLNTGPCTCAPETNVGESGLAALKELFPDLPSETAEE